MEKQFIYKGDKFENPQQGDLLIAEPMLQESFFSRSVVLLVDKDNKNGFFGLTMNRKLQFSLGDIADDWDKGHNVPLYSGGPVETDRLFIVHTLGNLLGNSHKVIDGLYVGGDMDDIVHYIEENEDYNVKIRFFLGYSGWSENQLEKELKEHTWAIQRLKNGNSVLKGTGYNYWKDAVSNLGDKYRSWLIVPPDVSLN